MDAPDPSKHGGVYAIRHDATGRVYIGQAVNIGARWKQHRTALRGNVHENPRLQHAWNKYGEAAFSFLVLDYVREQGNLTLCEQYWFDQYTPEEKFNIATVAGSATNTNRVTSAETRAKISRALMGRKYPPRSAEYRAKLSAIHTGRPKGPMSEEQKLKRSLTQKGRKRGPQTPEHIKNHADAVRGKIPSAETRAKMSAAHKGQKRTPEQVERIRTAARLRWENYRNATDSITSL